MKKLIAGMGVTGKAVAQFFVEQQIPFDCFDDSKSHEVLAADLGTSNFQIFKNTEDVDFAKYDEMIISPGWRQNHPLLSAAEGADLPLVAEVELAWRHAKGKIIAITGSNGKSTTTSLTHHLIASNGQRASLCGNIGVPFIACVDDDPHHIYVLELSSFQLHSVKDFSAHVAILLNLSPDHLDWHGSFDAYKQAKLNIFHNQTETDLAIFDKSLSSSIETNAQRIELPNDNSFIADKSISLRPNQSIPFDNIPLLGTHNRQNVLFAAITALRMGVSFESMLDSLPNFKGLEHRMEPVGTYQGRLWINDTKATNVHASQAAIDAMEGDYVLILGGCDKGERFTHLNLKDRPPKAVIAYGETAPTIMADLDYPDIIHLHAFEQACTHAHCIAGPNTAVLLAPACASFDQFDNFAQRGIVFKQLFREMVEAS